MKILSTLLFVFSLSHTVAQWNGNDVNNPTWRNGNVGIGTSSPANKLSILTTNSLDGVHLNHNNQNWVTLFSPSLWLGAFNGITQAGDAGIIFGGPNGWNSFSNGFVIAPHGDLLSGIRINAQGNVGIGTPTPNNRLAIQGGASLFAVQASIYNPANATNSVAGISFHTGAGWEVMLRTRKDASWLELAGGDGVVVQSWNGGDYFATGRIAIGTTDTPGNHRLYVNGSAVLTEVNVKLKGNWPDYVFTPEYKLPTLSEVETYIQQHQHLPEVPSAKEMEMDGINLSEMNMLLLKKVEELTLHLIDQAKRLETQEQKIQELDKIIKELKH